MEISHTNGRPGIYISYTDLSAIHKSTLQLYKCCPLDFFPFNARPPKKTKRQDTKNAGIRISVNGLLARSFRAETLWVSQIHRFRIRIFGPEPIFLFFFARGKHVFLYREMCFFFVCVCVVISLGKSFVSFFFQRSVVISPLMSRYFV